MSEPRRSRKRKTAPGITPSTVKEYRVAKGWQPHELATYAKLSVGTVAVLESGSLAVMLESIVKCGIALGVHPCELYPALHPPTPKKKPSERKGRYDRVGN